MTITRIHISVGGEPVDNQVIGAIMPTVQELIRATALHPHWPSDPLHAVAILVEELGELTQKLLQATYEPQKNVRVSDIQEEAIQVAAMGLRFLVNFQKYQFPAAGMHCKVCGKNINYGADHCGGPDCIPY